MGTWAIGGKDFGPVYDSDSKKAIHRALDLGVNLFDTAPLYGNGHAEEVLGKAFEGMRDKVMIATKVGPDEPMPGVLSVNLTPKSIREQLVASLSVDASIATMITQLAELNGDLSTIGRAREQLKQAGVNVLAAIDYLEQVAQQVSSHNKDLSLNIDLAELHGYHYHTGVVFGVFVPQLGQEIARGGRYDDIGKVFGRARPATGFSTDLKQLIGLSTCDIQVPLKVLAPIDEDEALRVKIETLRAEGYCVCRMLPGQVDDTAAMGCNQKLERINGQWQLVPIES